MNRHERRASSKQPQEAATAAAAPATEVRGPSPHPTLALRLLARLLLSRWVLKRVQHPDLIAILLQVAQQVGRTDVIAQLTVKLYATPR